ncbi:succinate dehydrogenase cytochrome b560 subunit, mitochondrial [Bacillus rossius redtenbacheri]|uniref:succinate dehydrogenase cytochrome b560 subunit, mitochondrial n=1 Tax=Bacillus rossius redtenbacheri TaxID=93214 RepID=UPI002FDE269A
MALNCIRFRGALQRNVIAGLYNTVGNPNASLARAVSLRAAPAQESAPESHDERNLRLGRPQSPHLTIYKFQLTSLLSISHRATGLALGGTMIAWGFGALVLPHSFPEYLAVVQSWNPATVLMLKAFIAFPFSYHYCNGIRHLMWDLGRFLTIKEVYKTGYMMLISSAILTGILISL